MTKARVAAFCTPCALYLLAVIPPSLLLGTSLEEVAGLADVVYERHRVDPADDTRAPGPGTSLRADDDLPVWGVAHDGRFLPLLVDGHVGAVAFWPSWALARAGGLHAARAVSILGGLAMVLAVWSLARRLLGEVGAWVAAGLVATSPQMVLAQAWTRADEQWSYLGPLLGLLALVRFIDTRRARWLPAGLFCFGLGIAAKNTALWTSAAVLAAAVAFRVWRVWPRTRASLWVAGVSAFLAPLAPQIAYLLLAPSIGPMTTRLARIPAPWNAFTPSRLSFFAADFQLSTAYLGSAFARFAGAGVAPAPLPGVGVLLLIAFLGAVLLAFVRRVDVTVRAFGGGLGALIVEYLAFYYARGGSFFVLFLPWVSVAIACTGVTLWRLADGPRPAARAARVLVVVAGVALASNQGLELARFERTALAPASALFSLHAQTALAADLVRRRIPRPWTTTYAQIGSMELLTRDAVRPHHAFPLFVALCGRRRPDANGYAAIWERVFVRMGPGLHHVILLPHAGKLEISPCENGEAIHAGFFVAATARGAPATRLAEYQSTPGYAAFELVSIELRDDAAYGPAVR